MADIRGRPQAYDPLHTIGTDPFGGYGHIPGWGREAPAERPTFVRKDWREQPWYDPDYRQTWDRYYPGYADVMRSWGSFGGAYDPPPAIGRDLYGVPVRASTGGDEYYHRPNYISQAVYAYHRPYDPADRRPYSWRDRIFDYQSFRANQNPTGIATYRFDVTGPNGEYLTGAEWQARADAIKARLDQHFGVAADAARRRYAEGVGYSSIYHSERVAGYTTELLRSHPDERARILAWEKYLDENILAQGLWRMSGNAASFGQDYQRLLNTLPDGPGTTAFAGSTALGFGLFGTLIFAGQQSISAAGQLGLYVMAGDEARWAQSRIDYRPLSGLSDWGDRELRRIDLEYRTRTTLAYGHELLYHAREEVPVDTGALRDSLFLGYRQFPARGPDDVFIRATVPYFEVVAQRDGFLDRARGQVDWNDTFVAVVEGISPDELRAIAEGRS